MKLLKTLGYIEVKGLSNAIVAADKMLKTADVELKSVENTRGSGWVTVTVVGDVAAVGVSIATAKEAMGEDYVSSTVLANPAEGIDKLGKTDLLLNKANKEAKEEKNKDTEKAEVKQDKEEKTTEAKVNKVTKNKKNKK